MEEFIVKNKPEKAVIVGGGFIGLEIAENLMEIGISVIIVELMDQVMINLDRDELLAQPLQKELTLDVNDLTLGLNFLLIRSIVPDFYYYIGSLDNGNEDLIPYIELITE